MTAPDTRPAAIPAAHATAPLAGSAVAAINRQPAITAAGTGRPRPAADLPLARWTVALRRDFDPADLWAAPPKALRAVAQGKIADRDATAIARHRLAVRQRRARQNDDRTASCRSAAVERLLELWRPALTEAGR